MSKRNAEKQALVTTLDGNTFTLRSPAALTTAEVQAQWPHIKHVLDHKRPKKIVFDASGLQKMQSSGGAFIALIEKEGRRRKIDVSIEGLSDKLSAELDNYRVQMPGREHEKIVNAFVEEVGHESVNFVHGFESDISFVGRLSAAFYHLFKNPSSLRWKDTFIVSELAGVNSFWICATIGILFGLILAFQSAIPMKQFGAEIYVASLVSMSLFRVLGPFIAAILFAARSGSAFAAEIGTMKVNEEIDALVTMGFDPISFLALPRVISGVVFVPLLAAVVNLFGLIGMFAVMISMGYPFATVYQQMISFTTLGDMTGGLCKSVVFGLLVAGVGCLRGLQTTTGSQAVGQAATKAVVSGIVLVVIAEGIFSVIFYVLGI